jgi:hypothetical protein
VKLPTGCEAPSSPARSSPASPTATRCTTSSTS